MHTTSGGRGRMAIHIRRRDFIFTLGCATACPLAARAQQPAMPVIGYFSARSPVTDVTMLSAFQQGLNETGLVGGRNVAIEFRWAEGRCVANVPDATQLTRNPPDSCPPLCGAILDCMHIEMIC